MKSIIGKKYQTLTGVEFEVLAVDIYQSADVSNQYKPILGFTKGELVAINYRGTLIPNITLPGEVIRLTKIAVAGKIFDRPKVISDALGIENALTPYIIKAKKVK
jgi:hypothetical protein